MCLTDNSRKPGLWCHRLILAYATGTFLPIVFGLYLPAQARADDEIHQPLAVADRFNGEHANATFRMPHYSGSVTNTSQCCRDVSPPRVEIVSPKDGETLAGGIRFNANAWDNVGVKNVRYYLDDGSFIGGTSSSHLGFNVVWDSSRVQPGAYRVYAEAYDEQDNVGVSPVITIHIDAHDTSPPVGTVITPYDGDTVSDFIAVGVRSSDDRAVSLVKYFLRARGHKDMFIGETTDPAYGFGVKWDTRQVSSGAYELRAEMYDAAGNLGLTPTITLHITNAQTKPPSFWKSWLSRLSSKISVTASAND